MKSNFNASLLCIVLSTVSLIHGSEEPNNNSMNRSASDSSIELSYIESLIKHKSLLGIVSLHRQSPFSGVREAYYKSKTSPFKFSSGDNSSIAKSRSRNCDTIKKSPSTVGAIDSELDFPFDYQEEEGGITIPAGTNINSLYRQQN